MNDYTYFYAILPTIDAEALVCIRYDGERYEWLHYHDERHTRYTWERDDFSAYELHPITLEDARWFTQYAQELLI